MRRLTFKQRVILRAWEKSGLFPFYPNIVLLYMEEMSPPQRRVTPEIEEVQDWAMCITPQSKMGEIDNYSSFINSRISYFI